WVERLLWGAKAVGAMMAIFIRPLPKEPQWPWCTRRPADRLKPESASSAGGVCGTLDRRAACWERRPSNWLCRAARPKRSTWSAISSSANHGAQQLAACTQLSYHSCPCRHFVYAASCGYLASLGRRFALGKASFTGNCSINTQPHDRRQMRRGRKSYAEPLTLRVMRISLNARLADATRRNACKSPAEAGPGRRCGRVYRSRDAAGQAGATAAGGL